LQLVPVFSTTSDTLKEVPREHLSEVQSTRGARYFLAYVHFKNGFRVSLPTLEALARVNCLAAGDEFLCVGDYSNAWILVSKTAGGRTKLELPPDLCGEVTLYTIVRGGCYNKKLIEVVLGLQDGFEYGHGTLRVTLTPMVDYDLDTLVDMHSHLTTREWQSTMAAAELARSRKSMTPVQEALVVIGKTYVQPRLEAIWKSASSVYTDDPKSSDFVDWEELDPWVQDLVGVSYDPTADRYVEVRLRDNVFGPARLEYSIVLVGPPGTNKTSLLHTICRTQCRRLGRESYVVVNNIDDFGGLGQRGHLSICGAIGVDDADMVSRNGVDLTPDGLKNLFTTRTACGIGCRYWDGTLPARIPRVFAMNIDPRRSPASASKTSFEGRLPWVRDLIMKRPGALAACDADAQAVARRIVVYHITTKVMSKENYEKFAEQDEALIAEEESRYAAWRAANR
jgi:hypothetical protein